MPRSALQRQALQAGALATVLCLAGVLVVERTAGRSLLVSKSELLKTVHDLDAAAAGLEGRAAAVPTSYGSLSAVAARKDLSSYFDDMAESPRAAKAKQPSAKPAAVDDTTARLAPRSVIHFVFSKLLRLAECWTEASPSPKTLKMGRRKSAVTMTEKVVSCANKGVG